jgi:hypothetical protein
MARCCLGYRRPWWPRIGQRLAGCRVIAAATGVAFSWCYHILIRGGTFGRLQTAVIGLSQGDLAHQVSAATLRVRQAKNMSNLMFKGDVDIARVLMTLVGVSTGDVDRI